MDWFCRVGPRQPFVAHCPVSRSNARRHLEEPPRQPYEPWCRKRSHANARSSPILRRWPVLDPKPKRCVRPSGESDIREHRELSFELPPPRSEEHTSELQSLTNLVCR